MFAAHWDGWADQEHRLWAASPGADAADVRLHTGSGEVGAAAVARAPLPDGPSLGLVILGVVAASLSLRTLMTGLPPLLPRIREDLGLSSVWLGVLTTLPVLCMGLLAPAAARLGLRIGVARSISIAMVAVAAGNLARGLSDEVASLYLGTLCAGAGLALAGTLLPGFVKGAFPSGRAGLAMGRTCSR